MTGLSLKDLRAMWIGYGDMVDTQEDVVRARRRGGNREEIRKAQEELSELRAKEAELKAKVFELQGGPYPWSTD